MMPKEPWPRDVNGQLVLTVNGRYRAAQVEDETQLLLQYQSEELTNLLQRFVLVLGRHDEVIHGQRANSIHATKSTFARTVKVRECECECDKIKTRERTKTNPAVVSSKMV